MKYTELSPAALKAERAACEEKLHTYTARGAALDLTRGKPAPEQLALSMGMLDVLDHRSVTDSESGMDCRNYGGPDGIPEARRLLAHMLGTHTANTIVGGNSSLELMFLLVSHGMTDGICGARPWSSVEHRKFLCPVPGYDRHFAITEHFGFELIPIAMHDDGPDMDAVEAYAADPTVKGIWCVPKYQNPTGVIFSDAVIHRFAALRPAAEDFRIFWDNAYCIHDFDADTRKIPDLLDLCTAAGNPDLVYEFCSTSKISFPGGGISAVAASPANLIDIKGFLKFATIGPDKLNQLRHARFFKNSAGLAAQMQKHAALLRPKFEAVYAALHAELDGTGVGDWTEPRGGYFVSYNTPRGCAKAVVAMCASLGVRFTPAGATYPYGIDPDDRNIRIAPSFATAEDVTAATHILALCTKIVCIDKLLSEEQK